MALSLSPFGVADSVCDAVPNNLVQNCGFESGIGNGWNPLGNFATSDIVNAHSGLHAAALATTQTDGTSSTGSISQSLSTIVGQTYQVSFWFMTDIAGGTFAVSWNGTQMLFVPSGVASGYSLFQFLATAHGTSSTLQFDATTPPVDPGADTWYVDDVSVVAANATPVPEPLTLLVLGAGLLGVLRYSMLQVPSARKIAAKGGEIKSGVLYSRF